MEQTAKKTSVVESQNLDNKKGPSILSIQTKLDPNVEGLVAIECGLNAVFKPKSVAVVGATPREGSVGYTVMLNLLSSNSAGGFKYGIYPINPTRSQVCGCPCYASILDIKSPIDLVVVVTPAKTVLPLMDDCAAAKVKAVTIISAGFKEIGDHKTEEAIVKKAKEGGIRVVGPNCLGVMAPNWGLNATFAATSALPGGIAFLSQSGAMMTAVLDWSLRNHIGFSAFVSVGNMCDVSWGDMIYDLGEDRDTRAILIYMETVGDARKFISAAKVISSRKPIIVLKAGRSDEAALAAASHTGSLVGSHDAFLAAMNRAGVLVVHSIGALFDTCLFLDKQPLPKGPRLTIITNAGGPGVLATDATATSGGQLTPLEPNIIEELSTFLPEAWSHANPVDILGDASAETYKRALEVVLRSDQTDGVLVVLSPQSVTEPLKTAHLLGEVVKKMLEDKTLTKPVFASWMGGPAIAEGARYLNENGVPTYGLPDQAALVFCHIWSNSKKWKQFSDVRLNKTYSVVEQDQSGAISLLQKAQSEGREVLSEDESKMVLKTFSIPIAETIVCESPDETMAAAKKVRFPCVVKLHSKTITHKSDVGGVLLNIRDAEEAKAAFTTIKENCLKHADASAFQGVTVQPMLDVSKSTELLLGCVTDGQFGPMIVFGAGGCMVEILKDTAMAVPPLTSGMAQVLIDSVKISKAIYGCGNARFPGCDVDEVANVIVEFSQMVCALIPWVAEVEINPLLAFSDRCVAVDARIIVRKRDTEIPVLAIRPYPAQYEFPLRNGDIIRPVKPKDAPLLGKFLSGLSQNTARERFEGMTTEQIISDHNISTLTSCDYANQIGLIYILNNRSPDKEIAGVFRMFRLSNQEKVAEARFLVGDQWQGKGYGKALADAAEKVCRSEGIERLDGAVKRSNTRAAGVLGKCGWQKTGTLDETYDRWSKLI